MRRVLVRSIVTLVAIMGVVVILSCGDDDSTGTAPTGAVSGTIAFRGTWPATGNIYVTVNSSYPIVSAPDAFSGAITEDMVVMPGRAYDYTIGGIEVGSYVAVLIGWRGGPGDDKCLGMYWEYVDSVGVAADCSSVAPGPKSVTVTKGATTPDIDMVADLDLAQ